MTELSLTFWLILVLQAIICGIFSSILASLKGYGGGNWFAAGFFFSIFGLIASAGLPLKKDITTTPDDLLKKCPDCAGRIPVEALVCKYCGNKFSKSDVIAGLKENLLPRDKSISNNLFTLDALSRIHDSTVITNLIELIENVNPQEPQQEELLEKTLELLRKFNCTDVCQKVASVIINSRELLWVDKNRKLMKFLEEFKEEALPALEKISNEVDENNIKRLAEDAIERINKGS